MIVCETPQGPGFFLLFQQVENIGDGGGVGKDSLPQSDYWRVEGEVRGIETLRMYVQSLRQQDLTVTSDDTDGEVKAAKQAVKRAVIAEQVKQWPEAVAEIVTLENASETQAREILARQLALEMERLMDDEEALVIILALA